ncbi:MAG: hypothetical protein Q9159_007619 [Coniocarpon cinnabarinum]
MAAVPQPAGHNLDRFIIVHVATTCDEHGVYVTKDSAEVIEIGWILLDASSLDEPIDLGLASLTTLTWEHVRNAGDFRAAIHAFETFKQRHLADEKLEWAFVTLDSWDLRVQLPREARDKHVVLPLYLQHSKTFDLRTEYQRWQAYHPESLPFASNALANICAALEVEPVQASAPIKHNLPFHLQALAPASPRRAMEESITLSRVLKGLIRKSSPPEQHPDVLSRPLDANADVRAFLTEKSKVLHMSGLPHDTTQSELESWFTQFGGRPIAFWTLKTPDQHKPTGTGFACFSSHEEAAESLCMNGRALNEKAIEVSPSSARVLDRASHMLTPFPPSKNRPRPGDWTCPSCGFSNFQRRTACFRCSYPAMGAGGGHDSGMSYGYGGGHAPYGMMGGPMGGHGHHGHHGRGGGGAIIPFRAGDWKCGQEGCGYHNFAKNVSCLRCGASRANAMLVADNTFSQTMNTPQPAGYGMHPPAPSMAGTPGQFPPPAASYGSPGDFHGQQYGAAPSGYSMPSGLGAAPGAYPPMGGQFNAPGAPPSAGFDSRAESAFTSAGQTPSTMGPSMSNGGNYGYEGSSGDPFSFLSSGLGSLNLNEENRRNGAAANAKSPQ